MLLANKAYDSLKKWEKEEVIAHVKSRHGKYIHEVMGELAEPWPVRGGKVGSRTFTCGHVATSCRWSVPTTIRGTCHDHE
jgi:hypothetical protein